MSGPLLVLGSGGHGRVVADVAALRGYERIAFLDDAPTPDADLPFPVLGPLTMLGELASDWPMAIAAVGHNGIRQKLFQSLRDAGFAQPAIVHPTAVISPNARLGEGVFIAALAVVNVGASIGDATILNTGARIDHDCAIGAACHIAPGATLSGGVTVGCRAWLGTGCSVRQGITIADDVVVGVGAAVVSDLPDAITYVGVPARPLTGS